MKNIYASLLFSFCLLQLNAQRTFTRCGTHELMLQKEQQHPGYLQAVNNLFNAAKLNAENNSRAASDSIYRIQTVFHVLYTKPEENIPDSVIHRQIEILNRDYRRKNADTVQTRAVFQPFAADAGIEFYLATTDPNGNPTTGITRAPGTPAFPIFGFNPGSDEIKSVATGGADPWPTDRYLNVWVGPLFFGAVLGYAFPPDGAPNWGPQDGTDSAHQGVVLHYAAVGDNFSTPVDATVAGGRSAVHEIGHYLGLRHIWGDGDCTEDDGISDTPDADAASQQTCDTTKNTCTETPIEYPDQIENYMDYSDDRCLNMFTHEQVNLIRSMIQIARPGIATLEVVSKIKEEEMIGAVRLYPNPTNGIVQLFAETKNGQPISYEVYNTLGLQVVSANSANSYPAFSTIDLSSKPAGVYSVVVNCGSQKVVKRVVVQ